MNKSLVVVFLLSFIVNVIVIQYLVSGSFKARGNSASMRSESESLYPLLSKRIFVENQNDVIINFIDLRTKLRDYHAKVNDPVGTYFEYLTSGVSIGVNEKEMFVGASLLKVPLVMSVYKSIEEKKLNKSDILIVGSNDVDTGFGDFWKQGVGAKITVSDAIRLTLIKSDNTAKSVLFNSLPIGMMDQVFEYLDIPREFSEDEAVVSPKNYSTILKSLYLSSYLERSHSEEILNYLTQTDFNEKIVAGVPKGTKVAHKIGIYLNSDKNKSIITDCGIVYIPKRPYLLCMMAKSNEVQARKYMKDISKIVYDYISQAER